MATFGPQNISDGADNGTEEGTTWTAGAVLFGHDVAAVEKAGFRWRNVTIPQGATINSATIKLTARNLQGTATSVHGTWTGHSSDDAALLADAGLKPSTVTPTSATVAFDPAAWVTDTEYSFTVTSIVAEIIARAGWTSGSDMVIVILDNSTTNSNYVRPYAFNDGEKFPSLTIDYTVGGTVTMDMWQPKLQTLPRPRTAVVGSGFTPPNKVN